MEETTTVIRSREKLHDQNSKRARANHEHVETGEIGIGK